MIDPITEMKKLLAELPAEFSEDPRHIIPRYEFKVVKQRNVRLVHEALWELQKYFEME